MNMMKMKRLWICLFLSMVCTHVSAGEISEIVLTDGTKIYGEVMSLTDGVYKLKSDSLGMIDISASKVRLIQIKSDNSPASTQHQALESGNASVQSQIEAVRNTVVNNPQIMEKILSLQTDPEIQKLLNDPGVMNAVNSGDVGALMANPDIIKILNKPEIQEIQKQIVIPEVGNEK